MASELYEVITRCWRRHERAREAGSPRISLLRGDAAALVTVVQAALTTLGQSSVWSSASESDFIAREWLAGISARRDLPAEAFEVIARAAGESDQELRAAWAARTTRERWLWLEQCEARAAAPAGTLDVLRAVLEPGAAHDGESRLRALMAWLPRPEVLGLVVSAQNPAALRGALALVVPAPRLPVIACVDQAAWYYLGSRLDPRSLSVLEQGLIELEAPSARAGLEAQSESVPPCAPEHSSSPPPGAAVSVEQLVLALAEAEGASERGDAGADELALHARSLAERRLFALLQAEPITRGLFELNVRLPVTLGTAPPEVELVCIGLRVALQIDLQPAQESEAYRLDRRWDVLLQHQGYLVSRQLARDVAERPREVVRIIREVVERRRRGVRRGNSV